MARPKNPPEKPPGDEPTPAGSDGADSQASYFLSLSLENVRCFGPEQTLDLSDGHGKPARWTIILGVNGTGKTTILQSLVIFELIPMPIRDLGYIGPPRFFTKPWEYRQTFQRSQEQKTTWTAKVATSQTLSAPPNRFTEYQLQIPPTMGREGNLISTGNIGRESPWCCAYGAGRRMGVAALSESGPDDPTASLFSDRADLRNPEEWLLRLDYAASKPSDSQDRHRERLKQVKQLLLSILPEVEDIRLISPDGPNPNSRAEFKTPYGWVPLRQLGYGYQTLITWVTDLANRMVERYPESPNPLAEPAVVAVDEIDLHLHPQWQRKLMSFLTERFPNTQFIATAHSPLVVQAAADANLAVLRREGDHVVIDNDLGNIRNWRVDQILTSDLFGLKTARPPQIEPLLLERGKILGKSKLTAADQRRLKEIEAEIGDLPFGETEQERKEREAIRKTLDLLMKDRQPSQ
jgi:hypothetical protein